MTRNLADLLIDETPEPVPSPSSWRWAVVTATAPLRIKLEGDDADLPITPTTLAAVAVGDRVWCQLYGVGAQKKLIIHGKAM